MLYFYFNSGEGRWNNSVVACSGDSAAVFRFAQSCAFSLEQTASGVQRTQIPCSPRTVQDNILVCCVKEVERKHHVILNLGTKLLFLIFIYFLNFVL
jgi:hypothetical protein